MLKNTKAQNLQQQARAQDAEVIFFSFSERHAENVEEKLVTSTLSPPKRPLAAVLSQRAGTRVWFSPYIHFPNTAKKVMETPA